MFRKTNSIYETYMSDFIHTRLKQGFTKSEILEEILEDSSDMIDDILLEMED